MAHATEAELSLLTDEFYRAALADGIWQPGTVRLKKIANGSKIHFAQVRSQDDWQHFHKECDPYYEATFLEPHLENPFLPYLTEADSLDVVKDQSVMPKVNSARLSCSMNGNCLKAITAVSCAILHRRTYGVLAVQRGGRQPDFDDGDISLFRTLIPVVARAAEVHVRFGQIAINKEALGSAPASVASENG